ncbi:ATPase WRNIP1-like [Aricia agestis]|uniref:ATPase WRNIP1-like n=1 Tax=Aricia agestis TaxID=91739 RepID=UPI001C208E9C|nr:ATPase WRNIP1-like [Aricia agestis]
MDSKTDSDTIKAGNSNSIPCPVCQRTFDKQEIEQHVNKCLFLNNAESDTFKRDCSHLKQSITPSKKLKVDKDETLTKVKSEKLNNEKLPLAEFMRPNNLQDVVGQHDSFGTGSMLHSMLLQKKIPNMILWGPPGCGKTSIANVVANICKEDTNLRFVKMSAIMSGINDVKEVVKVAKNESKFKRQTVLFMDEIHRFNKLQQDTFLPHVENGTIILIGATTENPSFSLNNALLSRCRVIVLNKLSVDDILKILHKAVDSCKLGKIVDTVQDNLYVTDVNSRCIIEKKSLKWLAEICDGDARVALSALEMAISALKADSITTPVLTLDDLKKSIQRTHMLYDRGGEEHYNIVSAIHKSIRASDDNAALYWTTRALHGGEDPLYIARRLVRAACEDIGLGDPNALVEAVACLQGCQNIGMPECDVLLAQCAVRLARSNKNNDVYKAMQRVQRSLKEAKGPLPSVPLHLRNAPTKLMKDLKYGVGYNTRHKSISGLTYMPDGLEHVNFFNED